MLRADMMKDAGNCATDTGIETFDRIDMNGVPNVFAAGMLHGGDQPHRPLLSMPTLQIARENVLINCCRTVAAFCMQTPM